MSIDKPATGDTLYMRTFYSTELMPCAYIPGRLERRLVTFINPDEPSDAVHGRLALAGFRRSQNMLYRPVCPSCDACQSLRIPVQTFRMSKTFKRTLKRNADLRVEETPNKATVEQYTLFRSYINARHGDGGMNDMGWNDYRHMVENTPTTTRLIEFRTSEDKLVAVCLTDVLPDGLSGVYKFYNPALEGQSLGTFMILWHIERALALGLRYVYLGYWISGSRKMAYKARFRPHEVLTREGWRCGEDTEAEPTRVTCGSPRRTAVLDGTS